jgi:hypothetical protein
MKCSATMVMKTTAGYDIPFPPHKTAVHTKNLVPMAKVENLGMMRPNDRDLDTASVPPRLALQIKGTDYGRKPPAPASTEHCQAPWSQASAPLEPLGPGVGLSDRPRRTERGVPGAPGNGHPMASSGIPRLLVVEIASQERPAADSAGTSRPGPRDEPGQSPLGCAADPWRVAQARHRGLAV